MDALQYALTQVKDIPSVILKMVFRDKIVTVEQQIINQIIQTRVLPDINLFGGRIKPITLQDSWMNSLPSSVAHFPAQIDGALYFVPPEVRDNEDIISVVSVGTYSDMYNNVNSLHAGSQLAHAAEFFGKVNIASASGQGRHNPVVEHIGHNILMANPAGYYNDLDVSVRIGYSPRLNNLSREEYVAFGEMVVAATKWHIYNELDLNMDEAAMMRGVQLGRIRSRVDKYETALEEYNTAKAKFKGSLVGGETSMRALIRLSLPS